MPFTTNREAQRRIIAIDIRHPIRQRIALGIQSHPSAAYPKSSEPCHQTTDPQATPLPSYTSTLHSHLTASGRPKLTSSPAVYSLVFHDLVAEAGHTSYHNREGQLSRIAIGIHRPIRERI